jgi:hypothetical protein
MTQSMFLDKVLTVAASSTTGNWLTPNPTTNATVINAQGWGQERVLSERHRG